MASIKRIIQILPDLGMSGAPFAALNILPDLLSSGCSVMVIAKNHGERAELFTAAGATLNIFPFLGVPFFGRRANETARKFAPDIIHALTPDVAIPAGKLARECGAGLVITVNRLDHNEALLKIPKNIAWGIIALSEAIRERLINGLHLAREKITVIPNGLCLKYFPSPFLGGTRLTTIVARSRLPIVGTYGTLEEMKGQRDFLQAAACVLARNIDAEFLIMGHGPDKQKLREIAEKLHITHRLTFSASTITDSRNITNIDIFVEPTKREGFGMSVLQAMATGVPVVACGVGGLFSLIKDGVTGLLVPANDVPAMSDAICKLVAAPNLRAELAHNAREQVEKDFNSKVVSKKLLEYFASVKA